MQHIQLLFDLILDLKKDITDIKEDTSRNTTNLDIHMVRWERSEDRLDLQEEKLNLLHDQIKSYQTHIKVANLFLKGSLTILTAVGSILGLIKVIQSLH